MESFEWSIAHAVYIPPIDAEHRELFRMAGALHRAATVGVPRRRLQAMLRELMAQTSTHFSHEERLMRAVAYPSYVWHKGQHRSALASVTRLEQCFRHGDRQALLLLLHFLSRWMNDHISVADRMLGAYLRNYERAQMASAS